MKKQASTVDAEHLKKVLIRAESEVIKDYDDILEVVGEEIYDYYST
jgi:hypothetical protein